MWISLIEIMDMREAQRSYEADLTVMDSTKQMLAQDRRPSQ